MAEVIVQVVELLQQTADYRILNDVAKTIITFKHIALKKEFRVALPYRKIETRADVEKTIEDALAKIGEKSKIINLTENWKGVYTVNV